MEKIEMQSAEGIVIEEILLESEGDSMQAKTY